MMRLLRAQARARARAVRAEDDGFTLIYVLMVTTVVTILVSSALVVSASSVVPSVQSAYNEAADAAAQGGLQSFLSYADQNCSGQNSAIASCTLPSMDSGAVTIYTGSGYTSQYHWTAVKGTNYFRVTSTGTVSRGGLASRKTVIADIAGGTSANTLDYSLVTQYETQSPDSVLQLYPNRTIALSSTALANAGVAATGSSVTWNGATAGATPGTVNVCNSVFYGSSGRAGSLPPNAPTPYVDWSEQGSLGANSYTDYQPCQVSLSHLTKVLAPTNVAGGAGGYASKDALLLSNGYPGGTGPLLDQPVTTGFKYDPATDGNCGTVGLNYRPFNLLCAGYTVDVGGAPASGSAYQPSYVPPNLIVSPPTAAPNIAANGCVYNGPTRVLLNPDGSATVTSPQTTSAWVAANAAGRPAACYAGASASGMSTAVIADIATVSNGVVYAQNDGTAPAPAAAAHTNTGWNTTGQRRGDTAGTGNTVFYLSNGLTPSAAEPGSSAAADTCTSTYSAAVNAPCAWTNVFTDVDGNGAGLKGWMSYLGASFTSCTGLLPTDRQQFECDYGNGTVTAGHDNYKLYRNQIATDLAGTPCDTGTTTDQLTCLATVLTARLPYSLDTTNNTGYRYVVTAQSAGTATTGTTKTLSSNAAPATGDAFFESAGGTPTVETSTLTPMTFTISREKWQCSLLGLLGQCVGTWGWGGATPQFTVTATHTTWQVTSAGTAGASYFPSMSDVTQYATGSGSTSGPGDLYVEGTATGSLGLVAQNDVVVTGTLKPASSASALEVVARDNVRVYHPVRCATTTGISSTTPGFCPDDVTGLYTGVLPNGSRPDQQYTNLRPDLAGLTIDGAVFALGNAPSTVSCPVGSDGGGVCGGMFTVDNYNRGDSVGTTELGALTVTGSVSMVHHGPTGEEWEILDTAGQTSRPYSGYQLVAQYENLKSRLGAVANIVAILPTISTTSSPWRILSVSTGTSP